MFVEHFEVPFVWEHRRDYVVHYSVDSDRVIIPKGMIELITRPELWKIFELGLKYRNLIKRKRGLLATWSKLKQRLDDQGDQPQEEPIGEGVEGEDKKVLKPRDLDWREAYFEEFIISPMGTAEDSVEGVVDGADWLGIRFMREFKEMKEEEDLDEETRLREGRYKKPSAQGSQAWLNNYRNSRLSTLVKVRPLDVSVVCGVSVCADCPHCSLSFRVLVSRLKKSCRRICSILNSSPPRPTLISCLKIMLNSSWTERC